MPKMMNMNINLESRKEKIIFSIVAIKFLVALIAAWGYFTNPHIIRQVDTMGVAMMYAKKFADGFQLHDLLPTTLAVGDLTREVTPMEFPLFNLLLSPVFLIEWKYNFALAHTLLIFINYGLFLLIYREMSSSDTKEMREGWILVPIYGMTFLYFDRFMPDGMGFLLCSLSMLWMWQGRKLPWAVVIGALGLLMKPPLGLTYALFLLLPKKRWPKLLGLLVFMIIPALLYYTKGMDYLKTQSQMDLYFLVELRDPIFAIKSFFGQPKKLFALIFKDNLYRYSFLFILAGLGIAYKKGRGEEVVKILKLLGVFCVQLLLIAIINGGHTFRHNYYTVGMSFVSCWIFAMAIKQNKKLLYAGLAFLLITNLERGVYRLRPLWRGSIRSEARELMDKVPELSRVDRVRSEVSPVPRIGLAFGKICNSKTAHFGVYPKGYACASVRAKSEHYQVCEFPSP